MVVDRVGLAFSVTFVPLKVFMLFVIRFTLQ